jgi:hypothetical protein
MNSTGVIHQREEVGEKFYLKNNYYKYSNRLRKVWISTVVFAFAMIAIPILFLLIMALLIYSMNLQVKLNEISFGLLENLERIQDPEQ